MYKAYMNIMNSFDRPSILSPLTSKIEEYSTVVLGLLVVLVLLVIYLAFWKEGFNPTQNLRDQDSDQFGLGRREGLEANDKKSYFSQFVQSATGGQLTNNPSVAAGQPGSLGWQILNSSDFACDSRKNIGDNAWDWQIGVSKEDMSVGKPKTDSEFSKVLAGH